MTPDFPLICKNVEKTWHKLAFFDTIYSLICKMLEKTWQKLAKNDHDVAREIDPHFSLICEIGQKTRHKSPKKWPTFFPYMQFGPDFLTKMDENWCRVLVHIFPLYAVWVEIHDQNGVKLMHILTGYFPLYAVWARNRDQNHDYLHPKFT